MTAGYRGLIKKRTGWLFVFLLLFYAAIGGRLFYLQVCRSDEYVEKAAAVRLRDDIERANRGCIYDRAGRSLAVSIEAASIYANRNEIGDKSSAAARLAGLLGQNVESIEKKLDSRSTIIWLDKQVDPRVADRVMNAKPRVMGVGVERQTKRIYPAGALAAQILGFTNCNGTGLEGLEYVLNDKLAGHNGLSRVELDAKRRIIPETRRVVRKPVDGNDVYLTIDVGIQHIAEVALARMAQTYKPTSAYAIVLDPHTGEILALANYPTYDPNNAQSSKPNLWRNRAVADLYEPGSTLKIATVAAALNEGISEYQVVAHCTGREKIQGGRITCTLHAPYLNGHGGVDCYKIIQQSCNIGAAHLAFRLGSDKLYSYLKTFGLLDRVDAGFGCEAVGSTLPPQDWRLIRLANIGFGQGIAVNALQMASLYATIANGGVYVEPQIVREIRNSSGGVIKRFAVRGTHRVVSKEAALIATKTLVSCVQVGTGKPGKITGRTVAGKTGSAQIAKCRGGYENGAFISSFMGFAPAFSPRLVIAVVVNRPQGSHWGATVAGPVFHEIGEKALWYLKVPSDVPVYPKSHGTPKRSPQGVASRACVIGPTG